MRTDRIFKLVYPDERLVTETCIKLWHADLVADGDATPTDDVEIMIYDMENLGRITVKADP